MKRFFLYLHFFLYNSVFPQSGIFTKLPQGELDVKSDHLGVILPCISLTSLKSSVPVLNPIGGSLFQGTLVYSNSENLELSRGFYYWNNEEWLNLGHSDNSWMLYGNQNPKSNTSFIGTNNYQKVVFKTNNLERITISENGYVGLGTNSSSSRLTINDFSNSSSFIKFTKFNSSSTKSIGRKIGLDDIGNVVLLKDINVIDFPQSTFNSFYVNDLDYTQVLGSYREFDLINNSKLIFINISAGFDFFNSPSNSGNAYYEIRLFVDDIPTQIFIVQQEKNAGTSMSAVLKGAFNMVKGKHFFSLKMKRVVNNGTVSGSNLLVNLLSLNTKIFHLN